MKTNKRKRHWIIGVFLLIPFVIGVPSAWAVFATAQGDTIEFKNDNGTPLANTTLTGLFEDEEITAQTDEEGKLRICRRGEDEDKRGCGLLLTGDGSGRFGTIDFAFNKGVVDIGFWDATSPLGKAGYIGGAIVIGGGTVALISSSGGDNNGSPAATSTTSNNSPSSPPSSNSPPNNAPSGTVTGNLNVSSPSVRQNPQDSCQFVFNEIGNVWHVTLNPTNGSLVFQNGLMIQGPISGSTVNFSGSGSLTNVNAPVTFTGNIPMAGGAFNGLGRFGPPLGGGNSDLCEADFGGMFVPN